MIRFASAVRRCSESRTASGAAYIPSTFRADYTTPMTIVRNRAPLGLSHVTPKSPGRCPGLTHVAPKSPGRCPGLAHAAPKSPGRCPGLTHVAPSGRCPGVMHVAPKSPGRCPGLTHLAPSGRWHRGNACRPVGAIASRPFRARACHCLLHLVLQ